jgi:hypothetical protein
MDGVETYTVRFYETERYDIELDRPAIQFMATTPTGTYCAEVENLEGPKTRERREAFKNYVLQCIALGTAPHEIEIG